MAQLLNFKLNLLFSDLILLLSVCIGHGKLWTSFVPTVVHSSTAQQVHLPVDLCGLWSGGCGVLGPGCREVVDCALVWQSGVGLATNIYICPSEVIHVSSTGRQISLSLLVDAAWDLV